MQAKDVILRNLSLSDQVLKSYVGDLDDKDFLVEPSPGLNPLALQIGHLISVEHSITEGIKPGSAPALPEGFDALHNLKEKSANPKYLTKAEYLRLWDGQRAATKAVVEGLTDADFDKPSPERWQRMAPTLGDVLNLAGGHTLMHVGQFVPLRRSLNKPVVI
jgi:hypothetical protein